MYDLDVSAIVQRTAEAASPLYHDGQVSELLRHVGGARIVMLGEATHGTQEFYAWRRHISERLINEFGFNFIAVEGDWPDTERINDYIHDRGDGSAEQVLRQNRRWPTWMWANTEVARLGEWLHSYNTDKPENRQIGFYGLDLYSLFESIQSVLGYLRRENPFLARQVQARYACFDPFLRDEFAYSRWTLQYPQGCHDEAVKNLMTLLNARLEGAAAESALFGALQNARIVQNAERYYRAVLRGDVNSWNIRDQHMMETLDLLLDRYGAGSKGIVWAHNTHIGDYRATDMLDEGSVNIGGLARQKHGAEAVALVGFGTHHGSVIAGAAWDAPYQSMRVPPGRPGTYEDAFHQVCERRQIGQFLLLIDKAERAGPLVATRGHRAIGVVYNPDFESRGNYVPTSLANRYDAFIFIDRTSGLEPLHTEVDLSEIPEAYPSGQ